MNSKISSEITHIELQEASYKDTGCHIEPTFVNFFFGNNGTGKSTIAKTILSGVGVTYTPGRTAADYLTLVYNQDFIDANFRSYRNMKGVFTLNAKNAEVQRKIDEKTEERIATQKALTAAIEKQTKQLSAREKLRKAFYKDCWDKEKAFREEFAKTQSGKGKSEPFAKEILKHTPKYIDLEEFRRLYDSAFSETAKRYQRFSSIADITIMDTVSGSDILTVSIVNSADTELAGFLRDIGATEWMRQGHDLYAHSANGKCPYCGRNLSQDFEQIVIDSFDTRYQTNLQKLTDFFENYRKTANALFIPLQNIPKDIYPQIDVKPYTEKLEVLKAAIQENIEKIKIKTESPALPVTLSDIAPILKELASIICLPISMLVQLE